MPSECGSSGPMCPRGRGLNQGKGQDQGLFVFSGLSRDRLSRRNDKYSYFPNAILSCTFNRLYFSSKLTLFCRNFSQYFVDISIVRHTWFYVFVAMTSCWLVGWLNDWLIDWLIGKGIDHNVTCRLQNVIGCQVSLTRSSDWHD